MFITERTYAYPIYGKESEKIDCLTAHYESNEFNTKLRIYNYLKEEVKLPQIRINRISAYYLKGVHSSFLPELQAGDNHRKKDNVYFLNFNDQSVWSCGGKELKKVKISLVYGQQSIEITVLSSCQILGLKQFLQELPLLSIEEQVLYYKKRPLSDENTLEECGMNNNERIEIKTRAQLNRGHSSLQKATGSSYSSIVDFEKYVGQMKEKIDIVCQISIPIPHTASSDYGSGFLIGDYLVMTNEHVRTGNRAKATFFYHGKEEESLELDLDDTPVCMSPSPGNNKYPTVQALDYVILRLKKPTRTIKTELLAKFQKLNAIAKQFFDEAEKRAQSGGQPRRRANIIQHPVVDQKPQPKKIAFRGNRIYQPPEFLTLHYKSKTLPGSSGSPVINDQGEWIGLHFTACMVIQNKLYEHHDQLCEKLGYAYSKSDAAMHCYIRGEETLYIHLNGDIEGLCSYDSAGTELLTFYELIVKETEEKKLSTRSIDQFILEFLQKQDKYIKENLLDHFNCNTAIEVERIFDDLQKNANKENKKKAGNAAVKEWKDLTSTPKTFLQSYTNYVLAATGIALSVFLGYKLLARKHHTLHKK